MLAVSVSAACLGLAPEWVPFKDRTHHQCGTPCRCGCLGTATCSCDGKSCPVDVVGPDGRPIRLDVKQEDLPARKVQCRNRPLRDGKTWYRDGYFWSCNDPECYGCN